MTREGGAVIHERGYPAFLWFMRDRGRRWPGPWPAPETVRNHFHNVIWDIHIFWENLFLEFEYQGKVHLVSFSIPCENIGPLDLGRFGQVMAYQTTGYSHPIGCLQTENCPQIHARLHRKQDDQHHRYKGQIYEEPQEDFGK